MNVQSLIATGIPWEKETVVPADTLNIIKGYTVIFFTRFNPKSKTRM